MAWPWGYPKIDDYFMENLENPIEMDGQCVPPFQETPIYRVIHADIPSGYSMQLWKMAQREFDDFHDALPVFENGDFSIATLNNQNIWE